jgi:hypothetical protein
MKKLICSTLLLGGMTLAGGAFAQDAECNAGIAWGAKAGCGDPTAPIAAVPGQYRGQYGMGHYPYNGNYVYVDPRAAVLPYALARSINRNDIDGDGIRNSRDRDRDGDGVRNSRDRYPDDSRYR